MNLKAYTVALLAATSLLAEAAPEFGKVAQRVQDSAQVLREVVARPEEGIPQKLLERAHCVGIFPRMKRGGFVADGRWGYGVVTCRDWEIQGWTGPAMARLEGSAHRLHVGPPELDLIVVVLSKQATEKLVHTHAVRFGSAGILTRELTDGSGKSVVQRRENTDILSFVRTSDSVVRISLAGASLEFDDQQNRHLHGREVSHDEILRGEVPPPPPARGLLGILNRYIHPKLRPDEKGKDK